MKALNNLAINVVSGGVPTCQLKDDTFIDYPENLPVVRAAIIDWCCDENNGKSWHNDSEGAYCSTYMGGITPPLEESDY